MVLSQKGVNVHFASGMSCACKWKKLDISNVQKVRQSGAGDLKGNPYCFCCACYICCEEVMGNVNEHLLKGIWALC